MPLEEPDERAGSAREEKAPEADEARHVDPDVVLDVPVLNIEELHLEVDELRARISLQAELADFVKVNVGVEARVNGAKLSIKGVEAQAQLKVRLEGVLNTIDRALDTIDRNPEVLGVTRTRSSAGQDAAGMLEASPDGASGDDVHEAPSEDTVSNREDRQGGEAKATEAAHRKARQLGVRLSDLQGSGAGGRILVRDVEAARG